MALIERTAYPRPGRNPSASELSRLYTPTLRELDLAKRTTRGGEGQQLAFLVMLKSFQSLGHFPKREDVPEVVVSHLRSRLGLADDAPAAASPRSRQRYRDVIREYLGVKPFEGEARRLAAEAVAEAAQTMDDPADLVNVAIEELVKERYELPVFSTLDRLSRHVRHAANARLFARIDERLTDGDKHRLDRLLEAGSYGRSDLNLLKAAPKSATKKNLSEMQERLVWLESMDDTGMLLEGIPNQKVANLAAQARALDASELKDIGSERRRAMLVCLIDRTQVSVRDALCEMLVKIVGKFHNKGKEKLEGIHREKRATTENMIELLERIIAGAAFKKTTPPWAGGYAISGAGGGPEISIGDLRLALGSPRWELPASALELLPWTAGYSVSRWPLACLRIIYRRQLSDRRSCLCSGERSSGTSRRVHPRRAGSVLCQRPVERTNPVGDRREAGSGEASPGGLRILLRRRRTEDRRSGRGRL